MYYSFQSVQQNPENRGGDPFPGGFADAVFGTTAETTKSLQLAANPKDGWSFVRWEIEIARYDPGMAGVTTNVTSTDPGHVVTVSGAADSSFFVIVVPFYAYNGTGRIISDGSRILVDPADHSKILIDN